MEFLQGFLCLLCVCRIDPQPLKSDLAFCVLRYERLVILDITSHSQLYNAVGSRTTALFIFIAVACTLE